MYWDAVKFMVAATSFPKCEFLLEAWVFIIDNWLLIVFLVDGLTSFIPQEMSAKYSNLNNHSLSFNSFYIYYKWDCWITVVPFYTFFRNLNTVSILNRRDSSGGPVVRNLPCNSRDASSIPCWGTKIPHAMGQLSPCITAKESAPQWRSWVSWVLQLRPEAVK